MLILPVLASHDGCALASNTDDVVLSSVTTRGDERWGGPHHPSWVTDPAGPWKPGQPTHPGGERPERRFPLSFPGHPQERPEGRGRRWAPPAKGPCHPRLTAVPRTQRAWGGAGQHGCCPVSQMWQWKDDRGRGKRFFSGQCSSLKERREGHSPAASRPSTR